MAFSFFNKWPGMGQSIKSYFSLLWYTPLTCQQIVDNNLFAAARSGIEHVCLLFRLEFCSSAGEKVNASLFIFFVISGKCYNREAWYVLGKKLPWRFRATGCLYHDHYPCECFVYQIWLRLSKRLWAMGPWHLDGVFLEHCSMVKSVYCNCCLSLHGSVRWKVCIVIVVFLYTVLCVYQFGIFSRAAWR